MSRVVVTDYSFDSLEIEAGVLEPQGCQLVSSREKLPPEVLAKLVADADAVITQFASINAEVISAMQRAKAIVRYGVGVDNVDLAAAKAKGIPVCNVPDYCVDEVADHTLALILSITRQVIPNALHVRSARWGLATGLEPMRALRDLTIGVVGFGRIGREVVSRLRSFKSKILVFDPVVANAAIEQAACTAVDLKTLLAASDIVTLHCPSTAETRGLLDRGTLHGMKRGAMLINVARGDLVNSDALVEVLESGHLSAAGLDVFSPEPIPADHPLLKMENVILSSHIASTSTAAVRKLRETAAQIALAAVQGKPLVNVVNGSQPQGRS